MESPSDPLNPQRDWGLSQSAADPEMLAAFAEHERKQGSQRLVVGCYLIMVLLPLGSIVDFLLYEENLGQYFGVRVVCSLLILPVLHLFRSGTGIRYYRELGIVLAVIPGLAMSWIIFREGPAWPYYAGLNLILLAMALVAQWTWRQSMVACLLLIGLYVAASLGQAGGDGGTYFSNLWFMVLTGIIMTVGSDLQYKLRFRDFASNLALRRSQKELETSYERLRELDELKGRFFANISHELRTPLTLLLGPLEALLQPQGGVSEPQLRQSLETMRDNGMRLLKLINDLLDLVRLDAGQMRLQLSTVQVNTFLRGLLNAVRSLAEERGLQVSCEVDPALSTVSVDADKLEKVFLNLLFNAIKFTAAGGSIRLTARAEDDMARFEVIDSGVGIASEHLPYLFSRFWQADSSSQRKYQGVGLGLALVKELVVAHGGSVQAISELGKGTTMIVRLPLKVAEASALQPESPDLVPAASAPPPPTLPQADTETGVNAGWLSDLYRRAERFASVTPLRDTVWSPPATPSRGQRPRVLVVDDEPDMVRFLRAELSRDYEVVEAGDGDQAITLASQYLPDVIVCDLMLPEKDGLAVCRELRAQTATRALPLLMLTARADDITKLRALEAGANDFLAKPFSLAELRARVKSLSASHQMQLELSRRNRRLQATLDQLRETESQLVQAEKMASLGRMSAGIIHEINNPLNFALTALGLMERTADDLPPEARLDYEETLRDVQEGLRRVAGIITDLRTFTHPQGGEIEEVPLRRAIEAALRFLAAEWKERVAVENEVPEGFTVPAIHSKLIQVFVNLLQNSLDALRTHPHEARPPRITLTVEEREPGLKIVRVRDNGPGIPAPLQARIFDPFFTTKEVGQGTGLGLSICYRLLNEVGASISVRSQEGEFCEFTMVFQEHVSHDLPAREALIGTFA